MNFSSLTTLLRYIITGIITLLFLLNTENSFAEKAMVELSTLNGTNGFQFNGTNGLSGAAVSSAGDVNGDGLDDIIIGAYSADIGTVYNKGESYVIYGQSNNFSTVIDVSDLNGITGFKIIGIDQSDSSGFSVSGAGDINNDGIDDIIIGAPNADPLGKNQAGESYIIFGDTNGFPADFELSSLNGTNGFQLNGITALGLCGYSVSDAGDVNNDGIDDVIISAYNISAGAGESYVVYGKATGFPKIFELSSLNGTNGFRIAGTENGAYSGWSVSGAGDINNDGADDVIIGAYQAAPDDKILAGKSYVIFGQTNNFNWRILLSDLNGINGFQLNGIDSSDRSGYSVSGAGDINNDGIDDLLIGAPGLNLSPGESYVVYGKTNAFPAIFELSSLDGTNGFRLNGFGVASYSGYSVSDAGDANGDNIDDILIGAYNAIKCGKYGGVGATYLVYGKTNDFPVEFQLSALDGLNGVQFNGIDSQDNSGYSVSCAGDMNGDGMNDLIIGAPYADPYGISAAGESYIVYGGTGMVFSTPPQFADDTLIQPLAGSEFLESSYTNIIWRVSDVTDDFDGTNVIFTEITVVDNSSNEVAVIVHNISNILGQITWYVPASLPNDNYYLRFEAVDSCSLTNSKIFFNNPFTIIPEPGIFIFSLTGLLLFLSRYFKRIMNNSC
jgi:hypothetical protein